MIKLEQMARQDTMGSMRFQIAADRKSPPGSTSNSYEASSPSTTSRNNSSFFSPSNIALSPSGRKPSSAAASSAITYGSDNILLNSLGAETEASSKVLPRAKLDTISPVTSQTNLPTTAPGADNVNRGKKRLKKRPSSKQRRVQK